jgi:Flp pilus assembly protein TadD
MTNEHGYLLRQAYAHFGAGRLGDAERTALLLVESEPQNVDANVLIGLILAQTGRPDQARPYLYTALAASPDHHEALVALGLVLRTQGRPGEAVGPLQKAIGQSPSDVVATNALGICLLESGDPTSAAQAFRRLLGLRPQSAEGYANLGMALRLLNEGEEALAAFLQAVRLAPGQPQNYLQLYKQYEHLSRRDEAIACLEEGIKRHPESADLAEALATAYGRKGREREAEALFARIAPVGPQRAAAFAAWLQEEGRFEESVGVLKRSLASHPIQGIAYLELAEANCFEWGGLKLSERAIPLLDNPLLDQKSKMRLCYALGKAYDREGECEQAIRFFDQGNALAYHLFPANMSFDAYSTELEPSVMAGIYTGDLLAQFCGRGNPSSAPLFIVGMIRSGTTLLDRIVSSHSEVNSAGELLFWKVEGDPVHGRWRREGPRLDDVGALASRYLEVLQEAAGPARHIVDKMPVNYRHLGLIRLAFPNAKVLHIRRNPLDTCLSIYMTFLHGGSPFAYRQENIVAFYRSYLRLMEHWRSVMPSDRLLEIDYEDLATDPEPVTRRILAFCGLTWEEACLSHERNTGSVATPSRWQVRQALYTTSISRGRRYEPWLGALRELRDVEHPRVTKGP